MDVAEDWIGDGISLSMPLAHPEECSPLATAIPAHRLGNDVCATSEREGDRLESSHWTRPLGIFAQPARSSLNHHSVLEHCASTGCVFCMYP